MHKIPTPESCSYNIQAFNKRHMKQHAPSITLVHRTFLKKPKKMYHKF